MTRRISTLAAVFLVGQLTAACQTAAPVPAPEPEPEVAPVVEEAPPAPEPPPPPPPEPEAGDLLKLEPKTVQALLGAPTLVRRDGHVQLMQFSAENCRLDVVFYEDVTGAPFEASHVEARDLAGASIDTDACLSEILGGEDWPAEFRATLGENAKDPH